MKYFLFHLYFLFIVISSFSQRSGHPFLKNYAPSEYNSEPQVWSVVQDHRGVMYFGGANGVLEYDGARWNKIELPGKSVVRSLDISSDGTIYVGSVGEFGYLSPDSTGKLKYRSLSALLDSTDRAFFDVWKLYATPDGIYFCSNEALFRYKPAKNTKPVKDKIKIWKPKSDFFLGYYVLGRFYIGQRRTGLYVMEGDSLQLVGSARINKDLTWFMVPYQKNKILIGSQRGGLAVYDPTETDTSKMISRKYFNEKALIGTNRLLFENQLYHGISLGNGSYALATIRSGVVIINEKGEITGHINKSKGLQSQTVHYLFADLDGGLWAALTYGIAHIEANSSLSILDEREAIAGSIYNVINHNGNIYSSSNLGLFSLQGNEFVPVPELTGPNAIQVFDLKNFSFPGPVREQRFLAAATNGIWEITNTSAKRINDHQTFELYQSPYDSTQIFLTENYDIFSIRFAANKWTENENSIRLNDNPRSLCLETSVDLWCIVAEKPVHIYLDGADKKPDIKYFTDVKGAKDVKFNSIDIYNKNLIFLTDNGFYRFDKSGDRFYCDSTIFGNTLPEGKTEILQFDEFGNGNVGLKIKRNNKSQILILRSNNNSWSADSLPFKRLPETDMFYPGGDCSFWLVSANALFHHNLCNDRSYSLPLALIRKIEFGRDSVYYNGAFYKTGTGEFSAGMDQPDGLKPVIKYENNDLTFYFSLSSYDNEWSNEYSYCLVGDDKNKTWSSWSQESKKEFANLSEGKYIFKVKAKNIYGIQSETASFEFAILPPWYRTILAYIFYVVFSALFIFALIKINTLRLVKEKERLERIVKERTLELIEKNSILEQQKEEIMTQAEHLKDSYDEILQKNTILDQQKEEILAQSDNLKEVNDLLVDKNEEINEQKHQIEIQHMLLEEKNKEITDSIYYAKYIQMAILPPEEYVSTYLPEHFILFKPKDIVSGDFYWAKHLKAIDLPDQKQGIKYFQEFSPKNSNPECVNETDSGVSGGGILIFSVADCTGHGVPGAIMSMLGIALLNEIINKYIAVDIAMGKELTASEILNQLRENLIKTLHQSEAFGRHNDGMDITMCILNLDTNEFQFCGANNPLYIIASANEDVIASASEDVIASASEAISPASSPAPNNESRLIEIRPDKMPVAIYEDMKPFTNHCMKLNKGETIYIFSDGFADQFGGPKGKKIMYHKFKKLILDANCIDMHGQVSAMAEQKKFLLDFLEKWKSDLPQVDDITIFGMRI